MSQKANYRITFYDGPMGSKSEYHDMNNVTEVEVNRYISSKNWEMRSKGYTDAMYEVVEDGLKTIGLEVEYYDTVFKRTFVDYMRIEANTEAEAIAIYNHEHKGGRFMHYINRTEEGGKCIRGDVVKTYYV